MSSYSRYLALFALFALAACGFRPVYGTAGSSAVAGQLATIKILPIRDRVGQILRNNLDVDLNPRGSPVKPVYELSVRLSENKQSLGITKTEIATRANLRLTANFALVGKADAGQLFSGSFVIISSYNILSSDFVTLAAKEDARRRGVREISAGIKNRLAAFFLRGGRPGGKAESLTSRQKGTLPPGAGR